MRRPLTDTQLRVLRAIYDLYVEHDGWSPSVRELADRLEYTSPNAVHEVLRRLESAKAIVRRAGVARGIRMTEAGCRAIGMPARFCSPALVETAQAVEADLYGGDDTEATEKAA